MIRATCTSYVLGSLTTTMGLTIECVEGLLRRMLHFCGFCVCVCVCVASLLLVSGMSLTALWSTIISYFFLKEPL